MINGQTMRLLVKEQSGDLYAYFEKVGREWVCVDADETMSWMVGRRAQLIRAYLEAKNMEFDFEVTAGLSRFFIQTA